MANGKKIPPTLGESLSGAGKGVGKSVDVALEEAEQELKATIANAGLPVVAPSKKPKGLAISRARLFAPEFRDAISKALSEIATGDLVKLGFSDKAHLLRVLVEAYDLLEGKLVAVDDLLGRVFEIHGYDIPDIKRVKHIAVSLYMDKVNGYVARGTKRFRFMNGYYEMAGVSTPFNWVIEARNLKIKLRGQAEGSSWVDHADFGINADGQHLPMSIDFKTEGVKHKLKAQVGKTIETRVFGAYEKEGRLNVDNLSPADLEGAKVTYSVISPTGGTAVTGEVDFEDLILPRDTHDPRRPSEVDYLSKLGVYARKAGFDVKQAKDSNGHDYLRVGAPFETRPMRELIEKLLADRSWQG